MPFLDSSLPEVHTPPPALPHRIGVSVDGRIEILVVPSIDWVEAERNYVRVHAADSTIQVRSSLAGFWSRLGTRAFRQIHRGVVVNVSRVIAIRPGSSGDGTVVLANGCELRMSRRYRAALVAELG